MRWLNELKRRFPGFVPGDYSVQRIVCDLGSAGWRDLDEELSTVWDPVTNCRMRYDDFVNRDDNSRYEEQIVSMLKGWAAQEGEGALGTMGIKFKLPEEQGWLLCPVYVSVPDLTFLRAVKANIPTFRKYILLIPNCCSAWLTGIQVLFTSTTRCTPISRTTKTLVEWPSATTPWRSVPKAIPMANWTPATTTACCTAKMLTLP